MTFASTYQRSCLAPRCRLITSWRCTRFQGLGCSPMKVVRELGLERCETVRSLSSVNVKSIRKLTLVREDWEGYANSVPIVILVAL